MTKFQTYSLRDKIVLKVVNKVCCCLQDISSVGRIVVAVLLVIVALHELEPRCQHSLLDVQNITDLKLLEYFHPNKEKWPSTNKEVIMNEHAHS